MNKTELIDKIAAGAGLTKADAKKALEATTAAIKEALVAGDKVQLIGFGTFSVNKRPAREGINPATKQKIKIAAKKVAKFKAGAELAGKSQKTRKQSCGSFMFITRGLIPLSSLLGLLADISQNTTVHIEHMTVDGIRSMRSQKHGGATQL